MYGLCLLCLVVVVVVVQSGHSLGVGQYRTLVWTVQLMLWLVGHGWVGSGSL